MDVRLPIQQMTYAQAIDEYGIDRPDLRFDMKLKNITDIAAASTFQVFINTVKKGGIVKGCVCRAERNTPAAILKLDLTRFVTDLGAKGLAWFKVGPDEATGKLSLKSSIAKFFTPEQQQQIIERFGAKNDDLILMVADQAAIVNKSLAPLRVKLGKELGLYEAGSLEFVWVVDFPLLEWNEDEKRFDSLHHPFTAPVPEDLHKLETDPGTYPFAGV